MGAGSILAVVVRGGDLAIDIEVDMLEELVRLYLS